jgi:hypothetical protein
MPDIIPGKGPPTHAHTQGPARHPASVTHTVHQRASTSVAYMTRYGSSSILTSVPAKSLNFTLSPALILMSATAPVEAMRPGPTLMTWPSVGLRVGGGGGLGLAGLDGYGGDKSVVWCVAALNTRGSGGTHRCLPMVGARRMPPALFSCGFFTLTRILQVCV